MDLLVRWANRRPRHRPAAPAPAVVFEGLGLGCAGTPCCCLEATPIGSTHPALGLHRLQPWPRIFLLAALLVAFTAHVEANGLLLPVGPVLDQEP